MDCANCPPAEIWLPLQDRLSVTWCVADGNAPLSCRRYIHVVVADCIVAVCFAACRLQRLKKVGIPPLRRAGVHVTGMTSPTGSSHKILHD